MTRRMATAIGFIAVLLWSLLALLTVKTAPVPPFQLNALCFLTGGTIGLVWVGLSEGFRILSRVPPHIYLLGTLGLFGYHALYFSALRMAPPAQAGLIAYLWPLLIVLFSGLLPGEKLRIGHMIGAVAGFFGAALIIMIGAAGGGASSTIGYMLAFLCALTWAGYSILSRRAGHIPTASVAVFCLLSAVLSMIAHMLFETTQWPADMMGWLAIAGLGLGPVGIAFFVWDVGVKRGDIQLLGVASYAAPLLSTMVLILAGIAEPSPTLLLAALLIAAGAALAARASANDG